MKSYEVTDSEERHKVPGDNQKTFVTFTQGHSFTNTVNMTESM